MEDIEKGVGTMNKQGAISMRPEIFVSIGLFIPLLLTTMPVFTEDAQLNISHQDGLSSDFSNMIIEIISGNRTDEISYEILDMRKDQWIFVDVSVPDAEYDLNIYADSDDGIESPYFKLLDRSHEAYEGDVVLETVGETRTFSIGETLDIDYGEYMITISLADSHTPIEAFVFDTRLDNSTSAIISMDMSDSETFGGVEAKRIYSFEAQGFDYSSGHVRIRSAEGDMLYKCSSWDFEEGLCDDGWENIMELTPGESYSIEYENAGYMEVESTRLLGESYSDYAVYDPDRGTPVCMEWESACHVESALIQSSQGYDIPEFHAPNTVDSCPDGSGSNYTIDSSIENMTIRKEEGGLSALAWAYCREDDNVNFVYGSEGSEWRVVDSSHCSDGLQEVSSNTWTPDDSEYHMLRVIVGGSHINTSTVCGSDSLAMIFDNDDLVFKYDMPNEEAPLEKKGAPAFEGNSHGRIKWKGENLRFDPSILENNIQIGPGWIDVNSEGLHDDLNSSADLTLYGLEFENPPVIFSDGKICEDCAIIDYADGELLFNVMHFTNYSAGANANLTIWDQTDSMPYGNGYALVNEQAYFYANYSNITSGQVITGADCNISFSDSSGDLVYNSTKKLYEYNRSFSSAGTYNYNVTCNKTGYEALTTSDSITISSLNLTSGCVELTGSGRYGLGSDLTGANITTASRTACINIAADNILFDCNGYSITNNGTANAAAIVALDRDNITVRNCKNLSGYDEGIYLDNTANSEISSNHPHDNTDGIYLRGGSNNNLISSNNPYNNSENGIEIFSSDNNNLSFNNIFGNNDGVYISWSSGNSIIRNHLNDNSDDGIEIRYSLTWGSPPIGFTLINNTIYNNGDCGVLHFRSDGSMSGDHLYNNSNVDLRAVGGLFINRNIQLSNVTFDNPEGGLNNYTSIDLYDRLGTGIEYNISWASNSSSLPTNKRSFEDKFINISTPDTGISIDSINWTWKNSELSGYVEQNLELWKYNSSGWTMINNTPDTTSNVLSQSDMDPASEYGILEDLGCRIISSAGEYQLQTNATGAPHDASEVAEISWACIKITSDDVSFDCNGYSITNDGTTNAAAVVARGCDNVTINNCSNLSGYEEGIYLEYTNNSRLLSNAPFNNTDGIYLRYSDNNTLRSNDPYDNLDHGIRMYYSDNNTLRSNDPYDNSDYGIFLYNSNNNLLEGNAPHANDEGIHLNNSDHNDLISNTPHNNSGEGVGMHVSDENDLINNTVYGNDGNGILLSGSTGTEIQDSNSTGNILNGIISTDTHDTFINASFFCYNNEDGIVIATSNNTTILDSDSCNNTYGVLLSSANHTVLNSSRIYSNSRSGVNFSSSNQTYLDSTNITDNAGNGVYIDSSSGNATLSGNYICWNDFDMNNTGSGEGEYDHCDSFINWDENGHAGCEYSCSEFWHRFYGNASGNLTLTDSAGEGQVMIWPDADAYNIYFADHDTVVQWDSLQAIGKNISGGNSSNDFEELDNAFGTSAYVDNINKTFSIDGSAPIETCDLNIYTHPVLSVPIAQSAWNSTFETGILWDTSDGGAEYSNSINQSTVWIVKANHSIDDTYGIYDFLGNIPAELSDYEGSTDLVDIYVEVR